MLNEDNVMIWLMVFQQDTPRMIDAYIVTQLVGLLAAE